MNDLELLTLAAKAVDNPSIHETRVWDGEKFQIEQNGQKYTWNPLIDDGEALRLAVALGIEIIPDKTGGQTSSAFMVGEYGYNLDEQWGEYYDGCDDGPMKATRLVIVRSAAQIGESK